MMSTTYYQLQALLFSLIPSLPMLIVEVIGIILAINRWQRHPRASAMIVTGLSLMAAASLASNGIRLWLTMNGPVSSIVTIYGAIGLASSVFHAAGVTLLLCGAFANRPETSCAGFSPIMPMDGQPEPDDLTRAFPGNPAHAARAVVPPSASQGPASTGRMPRQ